MLVALGLAACLVLVLQTGRQAPADASSPAKVAVLLMYADDVATSQSAREDLWSDVNDEIDNTNDYLSASEIDVEFVLVGMRQVPYNESGGSDQIANWHSDVWIDARDGNGPDPLGDFFDNDPWEWRNDDGADLIVFIVKPHPTKNDTAAIGDPWVCDNDTDSDAALAWFATNDLADIAHEMGHLLGGQHNPLNDHSDCVGDNHGHIRTWPEYNDNWHTIMAYPNNCNGCSVINYYSNPDVDDAGTGHPTGTSTANNAEVMDGNGPDVAAYNTAPGNFRWRDEFISSTWHEQVVGDFNGDDVDDVFLYRTTSDDGRLFRGQDDVPFFDIQTHATSKFVNSTDYELHVGDFNGDGKDDIFFYGPGSGDDMLWYGDTSTDGFDESPSVTQGGTYDYVVVGDYDGDGMSDILWYNQGGESGDEDDLWYGDNDTPPFVDESQNISGTYVPYVGDFNGNGNDDVFMYAAGAADDKVLYGKSSFGAGTGFNVSTPSHAAHDETYDLIVVGSFNGGSRSDLFLYASSGSVDDYILYGNGSCCFTYTQQNVTGTGYDAILAGNYNGDSRTTSPFGARDDLYFLDFQGSDGLWRGPDGTTGTMTSVTNRQSPQTQTNGYQLVGDFDGDGNEDIFFYTPGGSTGDEDFIFRGR